MKKQLNRILHPILKKAYEIRNSRPTTWRYKGLEVKVLPGVFHPGWTPSTSNFIRFYENAVLNEKSFLELGAGSGAISCFAASKGAKVTASDINPASIKNLKINQDVSGCSFEVLESDLFSGMPERAFDFICINPPFYPKKPNSDAEKAWFCGEDFDYFRRLFPDLEKHLNRDGVAHMILADNCDISSIQNIAESNGLIFRIEAELKSRFEKNFIFSIFKA